MRPQDIFYSLTLVICYWIGFRPWGACVCFGSPGSFRQQHMNFQFHFQQATASLFRYKFSNQRMAGWCVCVCVCPKLSKLSSGNPLYIIKTPHITQTYIREAKYRNNKIIVIVFSPSLWRKGNCADLSALSSGTHLSACPYPCAHRYACEGPCVCVCVCAFVILKPSMRDNKKRGQLIIQKCQICVSNKANNSGIASSYSGHNLVNTQQIKLNALNCVWININNKLNVIFNLKCVAMVFCLTYI